MLVYLCPLSLSAQFVSVHSLCLYVPFISASAFYRAGCQTQKVDPMFGYCWPTVYDAEPTLARYWVTVSFLAPR